MVELAGRVLEGLGVAVILIGTLITTIQFLLRWRQRAPGSMVYKTYRIGLARTTLLGLEILVAGDIVRTVAIEPRLTNVAVLAAIVGIRTVLSLSMQLEIEGRWPWQQPAPGNTNGAVARQRGDG